MEKRVGDVRLRTRRKKTTQQQDQTLDPLREEIEPSEAMDNSLPKRLETKKNVLQATFQDCSDVVFRPLRFGQTEALLVFVDGIVDAKEIHENALQPLLENLKAQENSIDPHTLEDSVFTLSQLSLMKLYSEVVDAILSGNAACLLDGYTDAIILNVAGGSRRSVSEPDTETVIRGPREGFTESLRTNTGLVRHKIKSAKLKTVTYSIGEHTKTEVVLMYLEDLCDASVIKEVKRRLESIHIDGVLESGYIEELIEDQPYSPFPQFQNTERPDTVAANVLAGRFALFIDGTPFVLMGPTTFWTFLQASEDYYERYFIANLVRWLRLIFLFIALYMPALYIAVTTFHQDMLPTTLMLSVAAARETIPFPALVEAMIMEVAFEALREASVRLPKTVGQAVSILGALVIGQAAVQAGIVSAPMVIVVSVTGIASFTIPRFNAAITIRLLRFPMMFFASAFGLFGIVIGTLLMTLHLCTLRSFGVPYLSGISPIQKNELKDIFVRAPWWKMVLRPTSMAHNNRKRMNPNMKPTPPEPER